jgi:large subunit ribosomal protein L4
MKFPVYNEKGKETERISLPKEIFGVKVNSDLVHQVVVSQMANRRQALAHTKDRSEVSGGGRKPWRQKGTGRARHGSIRSPLWRGGGVTFGPTKERAFKKRIPQKMKRKSLFMVLTAKAKKKLLLILDKLEIEKAKTKEMVQLLNNLRSEIKDFKKGSILIALPKVDKKILLATKNIAQTEVLEARNLNVLDLLSFQYLIMPKESIDVIKKTFVK